MDNIEIVKVDIKIIKAKYFTKTQKTLPDQFWQYWIDWTIAYDSNNINSIQNMCLHPQMNQYSIWIKEVKKVVCDKKND